jgi:hypothetical protein
MNPMNRLISWLMLAAALCLPAPASADDDDGKPKDKTKVESKDAAEQTAKDGSKASPKDDAKAKSKGDDDDDKKDDPKDHKDGAKGGAKPDIKDAPNAVARDNHKDGRKDDLKDEAKLEVSDAVVRVTALKSVTLSAAIEGTATVLAADTLFQFEADIRAARIAADFSKGQLARAETLFKDKVTVSRQEMETAARQSATDALQLNMLEEKLKLTWGDGAPFLNADARREWLAKLSKGGTSIVRLDFPGTGNFIPKDVKIVPLAGGAPITAENLPRKATKPCPALRSLELQLPPG